MGQECITNIDFSQTIIDVMTKKTERFEDMEYLKQDITDIQDALAENKFDLNSYDVMIDKGCLDCVLCSEDANKAPAMIENIHALLAPGGHYLLVSRGSPQIRTQLFEDQEPDNTIDESEIGDDDEMDKDMNHQPKWDQSKWEGIQIHTLVVKKQENTASR